MWQTCVLLVGTVLHGNQMPEMLPPPMMERGPSLPPQASSTVAPPGNLPPHHAVEAPGGAPAGCACCAARKHPLACLRWLTYWPLTHGGPCDQCFPMRRPALYTYFFYPPCTEGCAVKFPTCCGCGGNGCFGGGCATGHKMFAMPTGQSCGLLGCSCGH
jgi:hypothetical protein